MSAGLFRPGRSFLHRAEPRLRLLSLLCWFLVALAFRQATALAVVAFGVVAAAWSAGLMPTLRAFARFMIVLFVMCVGIWILAGLLWPSGGRGLREVALSGTAMGLRLTAMLSMGLLFLAATRVEELTVALMRLGLPFMPAFTLTLAVRLLPLFSATAATISQAQACRGLDVREGGPGARLRATVPLVVPLVLSSLRAADRLAIAVESRGLGMMTSRTSSLEAREGGAGRILMAASALAAAGAWAARLGGLPV